MTVLVGILCKDGVIVGSDSVATFDDGAQRTIEQEIPKIDIIADRIIVASTGAGGLGQRFRNIVRQQSEKKLFNKNNSPFDIIKTLSRLAIEDFLFTHVGIPEKSGVFSKSGYGALVAFPRGTKFDLCEFPISNFQPELKDEKIWYVSMGSGQKITDPFLGFIRDVFWEEGKPSLRDGKFAAVWALQQAIDLNTGGIGGPIQLAELIFDKKGNSVARILDEKDIDEHKQSIESAKKALKNYETALQDKGSAPDLPQKPN